jgi:hypothetical protein
MAARFFRRGTTKIFWVPTIASKAAPTAAEVNAGQALTPTMADIAGFSFANSPIPTPDMDTTFTSTIPGEDTSDDSTITFYEPTTTNTLFSTLAKGTSGYVVIFYAGIAGASPAASDKAEVWPVTSTGPRREYSMGNDPARWMVGFTPSATPALTATLS